MKRLRRVTSILLLFAILTGSLTMLTSCSKEVGTMTIGEWLTCVNDRFGIYSYDSTEPHIKNVSSENPFFASVQAAYEWNIIDDSELDLDEGITKGFVANTLVKAVGMAKNIENMSYDEVAQYAADNQYITYEYRGRTDNKRAVEKEEAKASLEKAFLIWSDRDYGEPQEKIELADNVKDYSHLQPEEYQYKNDNTVSLNEEKGKDLKEGDTIVISDRIGGMKKLVKVKKVAVKNQKREVEIEEIPEDEKYNAIEKSEASGSLTNPDLTQGDVRDGLGNPINVACQNDRRNQNNFSYLERNLNPSMSLLKSAPLSTSLTIDFKEGDIKVKGKVSKNKIEVSLEGNIGSSKDKTRKVIASKSYEITVNKIDYNWDIGLLKSNEAYFKIDYDTVDKTGIKVSANKEGVFAPEYSNGNGKFPSNLKRAILKDKNTGKGAKTIKILRAPLLSGGFASLNLDVQLKISVSGEIQLVVTTNEVQGIELKNGKLRAIKDQKKDTDVNVQGKIEGTLYLGVSANAVGAKIIGLGVEGGIGTTIGMTAHLTDAENHRLDELEMNDMSSRLFAESVSGGNGAICTHETLGSISLKVDLCMDVKTYGILKFVVDSESLVGKLAKGKLEIEVFNSKNAKISHLSGHWEDGKRVGKCTRKYVGIEKKEKEEAKQSEAILQGDRIVLSTSFISLEIGDSYQLQITAVPEGYSQSDIVYSVQDGKIAAIDTSGKVSGLTSGTTTIQVSTKDGKCTASCSVYVSGTGVDFTPLKNKVAA